jgi:hypothetical protein
MAEPDTSTIPTGSRFRSVVLGPTLSIVGCSGLADFSCNDLSPMIRGQIIDALMTVRVMPTPRGERVFDPHEGDPHHGVNIEWKR